MPIVKTEKSAIGLKFDYKTDGPRDRIFLPINSYFYETSSKQVWYKTIDSKYLNIWEYKKYTDEEVSKLSLIIKDIYTNLDILNTEIKNMEEDLKAFSLAMAIIL